MRLLREIGESLKYPKDIVRTVNHLLEERNALQKNMEKLVNEKTALLNKELIKKVRAINGVNLIAEKVSVPDAATMKNLSFQLKNQIDDLFLVLAAEINGKPLVSVMISENLVEGKGYDANLIIKELAKEINGGGGGQPFYATAGGKKSSGIDNVIKKSASFV